MERTLEISKLMLKTNQRNSIYLEELKNTLKVRTHLLNLNDVLQPMKAHCDKYLTHSGITPQEHFNPGKAFKIVIAELGLFYIVIGIFYYNIILITTMGIISIKVKYIILFS